MKEEAWKDHKDFQGAYQISSHGNVRSLERTVVDSLKRIRKRPTVNLSKNKVGGGYLSVMFSSMSRTKRKLIHILVAEYFVPNPLKLKEVNHKDLDKENNYYENLEWTSGEDNRIHAKDVGGQPSKPVLQSDLSGKPIREFPSIFNAANSLSKNRFPITCCANGKQHSAYGYKWSYI